VDLDLHESHMPVDADDDALSAASDLVVLDLAADELLVGSKATRFETIRVVGYVESLAARLRKRRMSEAR